jgi:alkaline phosphatase
MPETDARGSMVFLLAYTNAALQVLSDDGQHASAPYSKVTARYATGNHTGEMTPHFAYGAGAHRFAGIMRNDEIGRILVELVRGE